MTRLIVLIATLPLLVMGCFQPNTGIGPDGEYNADNDALLARSQAFVDMAREAGVELDFQFTVQPVEFYFKEAAGAQGPMAGSVKGKLDPTKAAAVRSEFQPDDDVVRPNVVTKVGYE